MYTEDMFKRFLLWASALLFTFSIFCLITLGALSLILRPEHLKKWGVSSGAYTKLPSAIINQAASDQSKDKENSDGLSLKDADVRKAAEKALTPAFFQKSAEQVIDGSFGWLDAKTNEPKFEINTLEVKQNFVDSLGNYLKDRYEALPPCPEGVLPESTDLLKINCRPSDDVLDINQAISNQKLSMLEDQNFLGESVITADSLGQGEQKTVIPTAYKWFRLSPAVFGGIALLTGILVIVLCDSKKFGVRKLGWRFVVSGSLALIATLIGVFGLIKLTDLINNQPASSGIAPFKSAITPVVGAARADILITSLAASLAVIALGLVLLLATRSVSRKNRKQDKKPRKLIDKPVHVDPKPEAQEPVIEKPVVTRSAPEVATKPATPPVPKPRVRKPPLIQ